MKKVLDGFSVVSEKEMLNVNGGRPHYGGVSSPAMIDESGSSSGGSDEKPKPIAPKTGDPNKFVLFFT